MRRILRKRKQPVVSINIPLVKLSTAQILAADPKSTKFPVLSDYTQELLRKRIKPSFFERLPCQTQIELLKRTEGVSIFNYDLARKISTELGLPLIRVFHWLRAKRTKNIRAKENPVLTKEKLTVLKEEFKKSSELDYGRALYLAHILTLPIGVVQKWFDTKRSRVQQSEFLTPPKLTPFVEPSTSEKVDKKDDPHFRTDQTLTLFREFKRSCTVSAKRMKDLTKKTNLSPLQISCWFSKLRKKMETMDMNMVLTKISSLEPPQIADLEKMYQMTPCISRDVARKLAGEMCVNRMEIASWFSHRRLYELFQLRGEGGSVAAELQYVVDILDASTERLRSQKGETVAEGNASESGSSANVNHRAECSKPKLSFFDRLTPAGRLRLLKTCKNLDMARVPQLAQELNIPELKLKSWFKYRVKNSKMIFSVDQAIMLEEEFEKKEHLSKDEAIALAEKMGGDIPYGKILTWWGNTRLKRKSMPRLDPEATSAREPAPEQTREEQKPESVPELTPEAAPNSTPESAPDSTPETAPDSTSKLVSDSPVTKERHMKTYFQKNALFEEFKKSRLLPATKRNEIAEKLHLDPVQVITYFKDLRKQVQTKTAENTLKTITALTNTQILKLTSEYRKCRYVSNTKCTMLAKQMGIAKRQVTQWFSNARIYELTTGDEFTLTTNEKNSKSDKISDAKKRSSFSKPSRLTQPKIKVLRSEFEKDPELTEDRTWHLFKRLRVRMDTIRRWFSKEKEKRVGSIEEVKSEVEEEVETSLPPILIPQVAVMRVDSPSITKTRKQYAPKLPAQQDMLFEAFKESPHLSSKRLVELSEMLDLNSKQIATWFSWMRKKLATISSDTLLESYRNRNLTVEQVAVLEDEFAQHPYIADEDRERLSESLNVSRGVIKLWFANRRYYEIVFNSNRIEDSSQDDNDSDCTPLSTFASVNETDDMDVEADLEQKPPKLESEELDLQEEDSMKYEHFEFEDKTEIENQEKDIDAFKMEMDEDSIIFAEPLPVVDVVEKSRRIVPLFDGFIPSSSNVNDLFRIVSPEGSENDKDIISSSAVETLEAEYAKEPHPRLPKIYELSKELGLSSQSVYWWYMTKRYVMKLSQKDEVKDSATSVDDLAENDNSNSMDEFDNLKNESSTKEFDNLMKESDNSATEFDNSTKESDILTKELDTSTKELNTSAKELDTSTKELDSSTKELDTSTKELDTSTKESDNSTNDIDSKNHIEFHGPLPEDIKEELFEDDGSLDAGAVERDLADGEVGPTANDKPGTSITNTRRYEKRKDLTTLQRRILTEEFKRSPYVSGVKARMLAHDLSLSVKRVEWFFEKKRLQKWRLTQGKVSVASLDEKSDKSDSPTQSQVAILQREYASSPKLSRERVKNLAIKVGVRPRTVIQWFRDRDV